MSVADDESPQPPSPQWPVPPEDGYTVDDLYRLRGLPEHTELIDGSLVFMSPQSLFHSRALRLLERRLEEQAPRQFCIEREMVVALDAQNAPEPDLLVLHSGAFRDLEQTRFAPADVALAVEVVSPSSRSRDRTTKPAKYAGAGIPHYWRVEKDGDRAVVYVFEREPATGAYTPTGIFHDKLVVSVPFAVEVDLGPIALN